MDSFYSYDGIASMNCFILFYVDLGSSEVNNKSLQRACYVLMFMLADRYDIRNAFYKFYGRVGIIGKTWMRKL